MRLSVAPLLVALPLLAQVASARMELSRRHADLDSRAIARNHHRRAGRQPNPNSTSMPPWAPSPTSSSQSLSSDCEEPFTNSTSAPPVRAPATPTTHTTSLPISSTPPARAAPSSLATPKYVTTVTTTTTARTSSASTRVPPPSGTSSPVSASVRPARIAAPSSLASSAGRSFSQSSSMFSSTSSASSSVSSATPSSTSSGPPPAYTLSKNTVGPAFLSDFEHQNMPDPTHGRVNYVSQSDALARNLTYVSSDTLIMRTDSSTVLSPSGPGRNSVRIQSYASYTTHVVVFDIRHMPQGCATWPAAWETGDNWPISGEVDVLEGVNDQGPNLSSLHTSYGCTMPPVGQRPMNGGSPTSTDCVAYDNGNQGCGVQVQKSNSYGPTFNHNGGGWYVMERTNSAIRVWFWARDDASVPAEVAANTGGVTPANWGLPYAAFPTSASCNIGQEFGPNRIIINLTLCGDWAGNVFTSQGCGSSCTDFVNSNPGAFAQAYWDIAGVRVYE